MSISKRIVVIALAVLVISLLACGVQQGFCMGDKPHALASSPQKITSALVVQKATHDQCIQSCQKTFPDRTSAGYKACAHGC